MSEQPLDPRARAAALLEALTVPDGLLGDVIMDAEDELSRRLDPEWRRDVELQIRLQGERAQRGMYDPEVEAELAGPLGRELSAALGKSRKTTRLGLYAISDGSVVLHYRVRENPAVDDSQPTAVDVSAADRAVRQVLRLHSMFEQQATATEVSAFGDRHPGLLKAARGVVEALVKYDLDMSATWQPPSGEPVRSVLSHRGRTYARGLFDQIDKPKLVQVTGLVSVLDLDGSVTISTSTKHRTQISVERDEIDEFELGEQASVWAEAITPEDQVGLKGRAKYRFVRHIASDETLDIPEG